MAIVLSRQAHLMKLMEEIKISLLPPGQPGMKGVRLLRLELIYCEIVTFVCKACESLNQKFFLVGMTRFELATPRPPDVCATGLRYIPNYCKSIGNYNAKCFGCIPNCRFFFEAVVGGDTDHGCLPWLVSHQPATI
jgi:hypothetical protein